jgi:hypothetical protein
MAEPVVRRERCRMTGTLSDVTKKIKPEPTAEEAAARVSAAPRPTRSASKFAPLIQHACKPARGRPDGRRTAASRQRSGDVRAWAKDHCIAVSDRGRFRPAWTSSSSALMAGSC